MGTGLQRFDLAGTELQRFDLEGIVAGCFVRVGIAQVGTVQREGSFRKQQQRVQGKCSNHRMLAYRTACCRTAGNLRLGDIIYL